MITSRTLGPVEVMVDGAAAMPELLWRKHLALLIYLARTAPSGWSREHLVGLLWADKPESAARHSLNEAIRVIRRHAGESAVQTTANSIRMSPGAVLLDVDQLVERIGQEDWHGAAKLVSGDFLEGFSVPGSAGFEDWLTTEREQWRAQAVGVLIKRAEQLEHAGLPREGAGYAARALTLDGRSERSLRCLLKCLALAGDRAAALHRYEDYRSRLAEELQTIPDRETAELAERIRQQRAPAPSFEAASSRSSGAEAPPPLVGREGELSRLCRAAADSRAAKRAAALFVDGDVGNGKSRMLDELSSRLRLDGSTVVKIRAVEADRETSGAGIVAFARGGLLEAPGIAGAPPRALAALARVSPDWEARFPSAAAADPLPLARGLTEVLLAAAEERAIALAVDDAHWLDRDSVLTLGAALRDLQATPFLIAFALPPRANRSDLDEIRSHIGRDLAGTALALPPLGRDALLALANHFLPAYSEIELDRVVRRVATDTAGVPFFAVEVLRAVACGLDLEGLSGAWPEPSRTMDQTLPGDLPDTVVAALRVTFRLVTPGAQSVLEALSVLREYPGTDRLARATGLSERDVEAALDELESRQWIAADARGYGFTARLSREVIARDMVTAGQRRRILDAVSENAQRVS
jgi:DNA-binding SARP family transcriptional activator